MILTDDDGQTVCRDLWALHLSLLPDPLPAEPYLHAQENIGTDRGDAEDTEEQPPSSLPSEGLSSRLDSDQEAGSGDESDRKEEGKQALNNDEEEARNLKHSCAKTLIYLVRPTKTKRRVRYSGFCSSKHLKNKDS